MRIDASLPRSFRDYSLVCATLIALLLWPQTTWAGQYTANFDSGAPVGSTTSGTAMIYNPAAVTTQNFNGGGGTASTLSGSAVVLGSALQLTSMTGNLNGRIAFDQVTATPGGNINATFEFRITPATENSNQADGIGFVLLNTATHGITGAGPTYNGDNTNLPNSLGISFDIHNGGAGANDTNNNHVSLHFNNAQIAVNNTPGFDMSNGVQHQAQVLVDYVQGGANVTLNLTENVLGVPVIHNVFSNQFVAGMEPAALRVGFGGRTGGQWAEQIIDNVNVAQGSTINGGVLQLTSNALNTSGGFTLPDLDNGLAISAFNADFDFRIISDPGADGAEGFAMAFVREGAPLGNLGQTGGASGISIEFDTHNSGASDVSGNSLTLFYDGVEVGQVDLTGVIDLENGLTNHASISMDDGRVVVDLTPFGGSATTVLDTIIPDFIPFAGRFNFSADTGGLASYHFIDNLSIETTAVVPEPQSIAVWAMLGVVALSIAGLRRRHRN